MVRESSNIPPLNLDLSIIDTHVYMYICATCNMQFSICLSDGSWMRAWGRSYINLIHVHVYIHVHVHVYIRVPPLDVQHTTHL